MDAIPTHYDLYLKPAFDTMTFEGRARISTWCYKPLDRLVMNAAELIPKSCEVVTIDGAIPAHFRLNTASEEIVIVPDRPISGGCIIDIRYNGALNDRLLGFYRSSYRLDGNDEYVATTQFEAADARRAFPCWDEPRYKATFDVSLVAPPGMSAISNMPVRNIKDGPDGSTYRFRRTPPMSTYLLYMGVGNFEYVEDGLDGRIRVVTTPGKSGEGAFALEESSRILRLYEEYFGKRYPLPKLDLIALPDFAAGAMENWGAITFRENLLLYDARHSSTRTKQLVSEVISHEIAHQWFGNLVTMDWWNDLWLNESFATFMATRMVHQIHPEWNMWDQFINDSTDMAMRLDSLQSTHPIDVRVRSPSQIREIFDAISYDKGASVLRMLEDMVGACAFRRGLRRYMRLFAYGTATGQDLWDCIGWAYGSDISDMVNTWLQHEGFPVLDVSHTASDMTLRQERFYADGRVGRGIWHIPVRYTTGTQTGTLMLSSRRDVYADPERFVANHGRTGFYRVQYHGRFYDEILSNLSEMPAQDRWGIQNDMFAFCMSGRATIHDYLELIEQYMSDPDYLPVSNVGHNLILLLHLSHDHSWGSQIRQTSRHFFGGMLQRLGWTGSADDSHTDAFLRSMAITQTGRLDGHVSVHARRLFEGYREGNTELIQPDIRGAVMAVVAHKGGVRLHNTLRHMFEEDISVEEKMQILEGMCGFDKPAILRRTLEYLLTDNVRSQNVPMGIVQIAANPHSRSVLWPWIQDRWDSLESKVGVGNPLLSRVVSSLSMVCSIDDYDDFRAFFAAHPVPGTERAQAQTLELISIHDGLVRRAASHADNIS